MCVTGAGEELTLPFGRDGLKASWQEVDQGSAHMVGMDTRSLGGKQSQGHIKFGGSN